MDDFAASSAAPVADLSGRVALVTGGARNTGAVIATRLAAAGATVIINHLRSPEAARATVAQIEAAGGTAHVIRASVARPEQVERMFGEIAERFGRLDILVNSAADGHFVTGEYAPDVLDRAFDTNVKGSLACAQAARPLMIAAGGGSIVNISTLGGGSLVMHGYVANGPAKAAVESLTRYLAVEYAGDGIRVNTAAAGMLTSPVADQFPDAQAMQEAVASATPFGRLGRPEEFAEVVAFLAGPGSRWITGQTILADGGLSTGAALLAPPSDRSAAAQPRALAVDASQDTSHDIAADTPGGAQGDTPEGAPEETADAGAAAPAPVAIDPADDEIVVVGMGMAVAGANSPEEFWRELIDGDERFVEVPADRWNNDHFYSPDRKAVDKTYSRHSAFITGFTPTEGAEMPTQGDGASKGVAEIPEYTASWLRHAVVQSLHGVSNRDDDAVSLFVGYTADGSHHLEEASVVAGVHAHGDTLLRDASPNEQEAARRRALLDSVLAARYPRSGPAPERYLPHRAGREAVRGILGDDADVVMVDTACSSSLYTIDLGIKAIREGRCDVAVAGGAFALAPRGSILFAKLNGLSARGEVRSLDADGDGVLFADGAAAIVLKTRSRAEADGDTILASIASIGSSSDGKGKAIYAPKAEGQMLAIERTQAGHDLAPAWVVAHATGTPAGDLAEYSTLRRLYGDHAVPISSNKAIVGHTGWAAGAVSVIQAILGLRHEAVPPQHRFNRTPALFEADDDLLFVPTEQLPLTRGEQRRTVAVSGFGFGGTNAHVLLQDPADAPLAAPADARPRSASAPERIAVVAIGSHTPTDDAPSFGDAYPLPPVTEVVMPPGMMRALDRSQLMVLAAARGIKERLGDFWEANKKTTGVLLGHLGPTRNAVLYATRCYLDDLRSLADDPALAGEEWYPELIEGLAAELTALVPDSSENTFPGMMPNVISSRIPNYYDLQGINMTLDTGFTGAVRALDSAISYLRAGDLTMALAGGINGNATAEIAELVAPLLSDARRLHEGAFIAALVTEATAREAGLPILGFVEAVAAPAAAEGDQVVLRAGADAGGRSSCYLGADAAYALFEALARIEAGEASSVLIDVAGGPGAADAALRVDSAATPRRETPAHDRRAEQEPADTDDAAGPMAPADLGLDRVRRHIVSLVPTVGRRVTDPVAFWPEGVTVVLTNAPAVAVAAAGRAEAVLLAGAHDPDEAESLPRKVTALPARPTEADVRDALAAVSDTAGEVHVRVVFDTSALSPGSATRNGLTDGLADTPSPEHEALPKPAPGTTTGANPAEQCADDLHQATFLALKALSGPLGEAGGSVLVITGDAPGASVASPVAEVGMFRGLTKVAAMEFPKALVFMLVTDMPLGSAGDVAAMATHAERESEFERGLPIVYLRAGVRRIERLVDAAASAGEIPLGPDSHVVAVGGGRGITAELLVGLAESTRAGITVIGSNDIDAHPQRYLDLSDEEFAAARPEFIREWLAANPGTTVKTANGAYARIESARAVHANLARMRAHGSAVRYVCADATDPAAVEHAVSGILATIGEADVDVLINAAGLSRSTPIPTKSLEEFNAVRDLKLAGFRNLRRAFSGRMPRLWINFGSLLGLTGQVGEIDYASGNDFLSAASAALAGATGAVGAVVNGSHHGGIASASAIPDRETPRMTTIGWTLWGEIGLGASELTKAYFEKTGMYSSMPTAEGVRHFLRELASSPQPPLTVHLGENERRAVDRLVPGFLVETLAPETENADVTADDVAGRPARNGTQAREGLQAAETAETAEAPSFFVDRVVRRSAEQIVAERDFSLPRDAFLADHAVGGVATLPGLFVPEIVTQVATRLVPGMVVHAIEDLRFIHFLKVHSTSRTTYKITGTRLAAADGHAKVAVTITSDVVAPNGTLLIADRVHFTATALMATTYPPAPNWPAWPDLPETGVLDPYHRPGAPVLLSGPFVTTSDTRLHPYGKRSTYRTQLADDSPWASWATPGLLLDGLARTGVLDISDEGFIPLAAPLSIARIDLYERLSDVTAGQRYEHLDLYAVIEDTGLVGPDNETVEATNRFAAVAPDGRVVARFRDLQWIVMGEFNPASGEFVAPGSTPGKLVKGTHR